MAKQGMGTVRRAQPVPSELTRGFWDAAARRVLAIQRCGACQMWFHPPVPVCTRCHSEQLGFEPVSGRGVIYSYTVMTDPLVPGFEEALPLVVIVVELEEQEGLVVVSNLFGADADDVRIGEPVEVMFEESSDGGVALAQFRVRNGGKS